MKLWKSLIISNKKMKFEKRQYFVMFNFFIVLTRSVDNLLIENFRSYFLFKSI